MRKGTVRVLRDICKGCGLCTSACPFGLMRMSNELNKRGYHPADFVDEEGKCTACGLCYKMCPDYAIEVYTEKTRRRSR